MAARQRRRSGAAATGGLPRARAERGRPSARGHHARIDLGYAGVPVPPALGAASVARRRRRAHSQGPRSDLTRDRRLSAPVHALARPADLHGRPSASASLGAAQLERLLDRRVGRPDVEGHDYALERRLLETWWTADLR